MLQLFKKLNLICVGKDTSLLSHKYQAPISIIKGYPDLSDDVKNTPADVLLPGDGALLYELSFRGVEPPGVRQGCHPGRHDGGNLIWSSTLILEIKFLFLASISGQKARQEDGA